MRNTSKMRLPTTRRKPGPLRLQTNKKLLPRLLSLVVVTFVWLNTHTPTLNCLTYAVHDDIVSQHNNILYFEVSEGAPNNTLIGRIRSNDGQVPYIIIAAKGTPESDFRQAFTINLINGDLYTNSILDREHREQYQFVAIFKEPFIEISCTVIVRDTNDNAPMFLLPQPNETHVVIDIPEGQSGIRRQLPLAVDLDTAQFGIKEFRVVSDSTTPINIFQLVERGAPARSSITQSTSSDDAGLMTAGVDNPQLMQQLAQQQNVLIPSQPVMQSSLQANQLLGGGQTGTTKIIDLEVNRPLDRENQSSYQLTVEALDGGQPPLIGRLMVTVNVQDINDNDPVFPRKTYECHVRENAPKGTILTKVQAYDVDLESNGQISYFIKSHSSSSQPLNLINLINSTSSSDTNNEVSPTARYSTTTATSSANSKLQRSQQQQQQQQQAQATSSTSGGANGKFIPQQQAASSRQQTAELHDSPSQVSPDNFSPSYKLRQGNAIPYPADQLFDINPTTGEVLLVNQLDFETDQAHELIVEARDHGRPSRSSFTIVKVHVLDVPDDSPAKSAFEEAKKANSLNSVAGQTGEASAISRPTQELSESGHNFNWQNFNLITWFAQMNSSLLFVIVLVGLFSIAFPVCLVKIKSRQITESDYNDTAGLTMNPNNSGAKGSPNHSSNNIENSGGGGGGADSLHYHHHGRSNGAGAFMGLNGSNGLFGTPISKRYQYADSSNFYHNLHPSQQRSRHHSSTSHHMAPDSPNDHQMAIGQGGNGSRGGTMTLHKNHLHLLDHHTPPGHHSLESHHHHHHQYPGANPTTSSLTYAHHPSRAALMHQAHHHQSSHQLSSVHQAAAAAAAAAANGGGCLGGGGHNTKGGTMNSHHSAHLPHSASPVPATPNTTHSSGVTQQQHQQSGHHHSQMLPSLPHASHHQSNQLPPTPTCGVGPGNGAPGSVFAWPPPTHHQSLGSTIGCFPAGTANGGVVGIGSGGGIGGTPGSTMDSCGTPGGATPGAGGSQPLDRWFDLGVSSQLVYAQDWYGSYNWDYLSDWTPDYHNLMPLIQADSPTTPGF